MYSELLTYDEICKSIYRDKKKLLSELHNTEAAKNCTRLKSELSMLVTKNKQLLSELDKLNSQYNTCANKYEECVKDFQLEADDFEGRKNDTEIESNEFEECRKELEKLKNTARKLEQSILQIAKKADEIASVIDTNTAEGRKKNKQYKLAQEQAESEKSAKAADFEALDKKREDAGKNVDSKLRTQYDRIAEVHMDPIASVANGRCSGCNMTLPSSMLGKVSAGEVILCENCGRMIIEETK